MSFRTKLEMAVHRETRLADELTTKLKQVEAELAEETSLDNIRPDQRKIADLVREREKTIDSIEVHLEKARAAELDLEFLDKRGQQMEEGRTLSIGKARSPAED